MGFVCQIEADAKGDRVRPASGAAAAAEPATFSEVTDSDSRYDVCTVQR